MHTRAWPIAVTVPLLCLLAASGAQPATPAPAASLTYIDGSSVKLEQIIGDCDWQHLDYTTGKGTCKPTTSQTATRYHLLTDGQASSFEDNGKIIFLCGDARSASPNFVSHAHYDGGRQSEDTKGVYFTSAPAPWGPWVPPQLIFNPKRDHGFGVFIHDPTITPGPPGDGLNGPLVGPGDPSMVRGEPFAPLMIERFTTVAGDTLKIYYTTGTYNPYTVVKMPSEFTITR